MAGHRRKFFDYAQTHSDELSISLQPRLNGYIKEKPSPKQRAGLLLDHILEGFYGGAGGGGKSSWLLMSGLQYADVPGYAGLIFRKNYPDLIQPGGLIDRSHRWLDGTDAHWSEKNKTWTFPTEEHNNPARLVFGFLDNYKARERYKGGEYHFIGADELSDFEERTFKWMRSRLRRKAGVKIPLRLRAGSNPGGKGHSWIRRRYIPPWSKGHPDRFFIPAKVGDNPGLDIEGYRRSLSDLDPVTRQRIEDGDWSVVDAGNMFKFHWFEGKVKEEHPAFESMELVRRWDFADSEPSPEYPDPDWTVGLLMGLDTQGRIWILDIKRERISSGGVEKLVRATAEQDGDGVRVWIPQDPGQAGKDQAWRYKRKVLMGFSCDHERETGSKEVRARGFASACEAGNVYIVDRHWTEEYLDEICQFFSEAKDDQVDASSGAFNVLSKRVVPEDRGEEPVKRRPDDRYEDDMEDVSTADPDWDKEW